jgi:hypothetical protein
MELHGSGAFQLKVFWGSLKGIDDRPWGFLDAMARETSAHRSCETLEVVGTPILPWEIQLLLF